MTKPTIKRNSNGTVVCTVSFTAEQTSAAEERAISRLGSKVTIPGFRIGKAPADKVRERLKETAITEEIIRDLLPETIGTLAKEENIVPILQPSVEVVSKEPLSIAITFTEMPTATVKGIDKLKIERKPIALDQKEVDRMVQYIMKQHETATVVDRSAKTSDKVTMNFYGEDMEGNEIENTRSEGYKAVIGSNALIPGFEDALIGLKAGQKKSFEITFPAKYQAEHLRNKQAVFHVEVLQVEEVLSPELTDEFAKNSLHTESKQAFLDEVEKSMKEQEEDIERKRRESALLEKITELTKVELPDTLINEEVRHLIGEFEEQLHRQKMTLAEWLEASQNTAEEAMENFKKNASKRITLRLGMQQLVKDRALTIPEEEVNAALAARKNENIAPNTAAYEQLLWQLKVEKLIEEMLAR